MSATDVIKLFELIWDILGPVATKMFERACSGEDPVDVLLDEKILDILPAKSRTEIAMLQAKAGLR